VIHGILKKIQEKYISPLCALKSDGTLGTTAKIGDFFSYGTECPCCLGLRIFLGIIFGVLIGISISKYL